MNIAGKYQPYRGYGCARPWNWYYSYPNIPRRVRTRGDWRLDTPLVDEDGDANAFWHRPFVGRRDSIYEKRLAHRVFRRRAKAAIRRELAGDDAVSHNFRYYGDWLD